MKKINLLLTFILLSSVAWAQVYIPLPGDQTGKDFHNQKAKTVEELLQKNNNPFYKAHSARNSYLVVSNYRNGKRWYYFEGDLIRFKTKDGVYFEDEISYIDSLTFSITGYDKVARRIEENTFTTSDIAIVYKHKRARALNTALISMAGFIPMALIDWGVYNNNPLENSDLLLIAPIVGAGNVLLFNHKSIFNKQRLRNNKSLRIIVPR